MLFLKKVEKVHDCCYMFMTRLSFWILFRRRSPCFMVAWEEKQNIFQLELNFTFINKTKNTN